MSDRFALIVMHYQPDVFDLVFENAAGGAADRGRIVAACNDAIARCRRKGGEVVFANFVLPAVELGPPADRNKAVSDLGRNFPDRFRNSACVRDIHRLPHDSVYACPRASVFASTTLHRDLGDRGIRHVRLAGVTSSGVVLSSVAWASDADYRIDLLRSCCFDPDAVAHDALFRTGFATRATIC